MCSYSNVSLSGIKTKVGISTCTIDDNLTFALQITRDLSETLIEVHSSSVGHAEVLSMARQELWDRCDFVSKQLELITHDMKDKIR